MLIFGFRDLPRPKGWGDFYFRLPPSRRENFVGNLDLYQASGDDLRILFEKGIRQAEEKSQESEQIRRFLANGEYQTENIAAWAAEILKEMIDQHRFSCYYLNCIDRSDPHKTAHIRTQRISIPA